MFRCVSVLILGKKARYESNVGVKKTSEILILFSEKERREKERMLFLCANPVVCPR